MANGNATHTCPTGPADLSASLLADVPFIAIGILGFAVAKLLFAFNGMSRGSLLILLSVFAAFLAVIFDSFRIFRPTACSKEMLDALAHLCELFLSVSVFIRYLFFLHSARWPDGSGANTMRLWERPVLRTICDCVLLLLAVAIFVLQLVWRFAHLPIIHTVDAALEICWTTLVAFKLCYASGAARKAGNGPTCAKLFLPLVAALFIEWGISVGNLVVSYFADCVAGRFLQAAETYIILLALTTSTFSNIISPTSISCAASLTGPGDTGWTRRIMGKAAHNDDVEKQQPWTQSPVSTELEIASIKTSEIMQWRGKRDDPGRYSAPINDSGTSSLQDLSLLNFPTGVSRGGPTAPRILSLNGVLSSSALPRMGSVRSQHTCDYIAGGASGIEKGHSAGLQARAPRRSSAPTVMVTSGYDSQHTHVRRAMNSAIGPPLPQRIATLDRLRVASRSPDARASLCSTPYSVINGDATLYRARRSEAENASLLDHARKSVRSNISLSIFPPTGSPALETHLPTSPSTPATPFSEDGLRMVAVDLTSPRSTPSATQWDVTSFIDEISDPPKATAPPARAQSSPDADSDRREPISTTSLPPSPILPRPPPRVQLERNGDIFATLVSMMTGQDMAEPAPQGNPAQLSPVSEPVMLPPTAFGSLAPSDASPPR